LDSDLTDTNLDEQIAKAEERAYAAREAALGRENVGGSMVGDRLRDPRFKRGVRKGGRNSAKLRSMRARKLYRTLKPEINKLRAEGKTYDEVAAALNAGGYTTTIGTLFNGPTVFRICKRR
jgi:hypothetical protein